MSSLLQHHGSTTDKPKPGYVELLMYKQQSGWSGFTCSHCGQSNDTTNWYCCKCRRLIVCVVDHRNPKGEQCEYRHDNFDPTVDTPGFTCILGNRLLTVDSEPVQLDRPDGSVTTLSKLYRIWRKPVGMFGCWVVFRWNNEEHVPDLSVPIGVNKLPRDARPLTDEEASAYWFK